MWHFVDPRPPHPRVLNIIWIAPKSGLKKISDAFLTDFYYYLRNYQIIFFLFTANCWSSRGIRFQDQVIMHLKIVTRRVDLQYIKKDAFLIVRTNVQYGRIYCFRRPAIKLLTHLLTNQPRKMQEIILASRMGVSRLMDVLVSIGNVQLYVAVASTLYFFSNVTFCDIFRSTVVRFYVTTPYSCWSSWQRATPTSRRSSLSKTHSTSW